jgi:hypothetical protein
MEMKMREHAMEDKRLGAVTLDRGGQRYVGEWSINEEMITVTLRGNGSKTTQLGDSANMPDDLAMTMLVELITEHLYRRKS